MDERSSSDDVSAVRGSLVDSRRLLFEKIVTEQANRPEAADEAAAVIRQNGRLPRSVRASKVNSFRDELVPSNRVDVCQSSSSSSSSTNSSAKATVVRRRSHNDKDFAVDHQRGAADERTSPVPSPADARHSPPSLPTLPPSQTVLPSAAASETSPPCGETFPQVPRNECHSPEGHLSSCSNASPEATVLCQSSADASSPNYSKRISYHHAVLNGAKLKLAKTFSPPEAVPETACSNGSASNGESGIDDSVDLSRAASPRLRKCESGSLAAVDATSKISSPVEDLSASINSRRRSSSSSSCGTCEPTVAVSANDEPASIDAADELAQTAGSGDAVPSADSDKLTSSADPEQTTCSALTNSSVPSAASNESEPPVVANKLTKPAISSKPVPPVVKNKPIHSPTPVTTAAVVTVDYPDELNPFGDDDEDIDDSRNPLETSRVDVGLEHDSTNPFGSDSDEDDVNESKSTAASTNPFWSGSEEDDDEEAENHSQDSSVRTPVPLPRTVKKPIASTSPQPSPRPRPRVTTGYSSNEISPASSCRKLSTDSAELSFHRSSNSINSTPRKKKPAPPPPPLQTNANRSVTKDEQIKNSNHEQMKIIDAAKISLNDSNVSANDLKDGVNKKVVGQWKNKKRPAPARPAPLRRPVKEMPLEDIKVELDDIEIRYQELERQTTQLEEKIRVKTELESAESSAVEEMVVQLFELVNEKNELFRRRSELVNMRKMHSLEVEQADIEYQIRCLMLRPESNKTDTDKASEEVLLKRLVEVVEKRNEIIDLMDKDRLRETVEDQSVTTQLEPKSKKDQRSKEKKKKSKKEKHKEPDDGDKHSPSKIIKQKFMTLRHTARKLHPKLPD